MYGKGVWLQGFNLGVFKKLHHPGTREGGVSEKMILDYVGGGRGIAKDDR